MLSTTEQVERMSVAAPASIEGCALIQLVGKKYLAGRLFYDHQLGMPMPRVEVPATLTIPAFTKYLHTQAIFEVQPCSAAQMQEAAELLKVHPFPPMLFDAEEAR